MHLNVLFFMTSGGDRSSSIISLDDDRKDATFLNKDHVRCCEGLKLVACPHLRKGMIGHTVVSPFEHLTRDMS